MQESITEWRIAAPLVIKPAIAMERTPGSSPERKNVFTIVKKTKNATTNRSD